nr:prepilin-type N-terminal cleavage/methylation domain-containing protein [uncultured Campylobacter sp.]
MKKKGFSLIELILSIVIVGLTMATVPNLIAKVSENNRLALVQESVMDGKTRMGLVLTAPWGCTNDISLQLAPTPIFGGLANFYTLNGIDGTRRRNFSAIARDTACASWEQNLDSYNNNRINMNNTPQNATTTYSRDNIISSTLVTSVDNTNMSGVANRDIKQVTITVTTNNTNANNNGHQIILRAYSANIGDAPALLTKVW